MALDAPVHLTLDAHQLRVTVCYPLLIAADPTAQSFTYMQHWQHFPARDVPSRWQTALRLAHAAAAEASSRHAQDSCPDASRPCGQPKHAHSQPHSTCPFPRPVSAAEVCLAAPSPNFIEPCHTYGEPFLRQTLPHDQYKSSQRICQDPAQGRATLGDSASIISHQQDMSSPSALGQQISQSAQMDPADAATAAASPHLNSQQHQVQQLPGSAAMATSVDTSWDPQVRSWQPWQGDCCSFTELPVSGSLRGNEAASLAFAGLPPAPLPVPLQPAACRAAADAQATCRLNYW